MNKRQLKKQIWKGVSPYWYRDYYAKRVPNNRWRACQKIDYRLMMKQMKREKSPDVDC